eukprot:evm.model.scf_3444.2 EVM.evm.TU.scf_3444.2   scf_3444:10924-11252(-)
MAHSTADLNAALAAVRQNLDALLDGVRSEIAHAADVRQQAADCKSAREGIEREAAAAVEELAEAAGREADLAVLVESAREERGKEGELAAGLEVRGMS